MWKYWIEIIAMDDRNVFCGLVLVAMWIMVIFRTVQTSVEIIESLEDV
jgi:hypothetical protein